MGKHSTLSSEQRHSVEKLIHAGTLPARSLMHAHILLIAGQIDRSNRHLASLSNHFTQRKRFVEQGMQEALHRKQQGKRPEKQTLDGVQEAHIIAVLCHGSRVACAGCKRCVELEIVSERPKRCVIC